MIIIPAIDIYQKKCVRLHQGRKTESKVYNQNPVSIAELFTNQGAEIIHIVDLSSAIEKDTCNQETIKKIIMNTDVKIQLGGGINTLKKIEMWLNSGIYRVIIGSKAAEDTAFITRAVNNFGSDKICISVDFIGNNIAVNGWREILKYNFVDFGKKIKECGVSRFIVTDISRDGTLKGPSIEKTVKFAKLVNNKVTISGGVSDLKDIYLINDYKNFGIDSIIIGKAIYEGCFTYKDAVMCLNSRRKYAHKKNNPVP